MLPRLPLPWVLRLLFVLRLAAGALLLVLTGGQAAHAQKALLLDSLRDRLARPGLPDTIRVVYLADLSGKLISTDLPAARRYAEQSVALARRLGYPRCEAVALSTLAATHYYASDYPAAQRCFEATLIAARRAGLPTQIGHAYLGLGNVAQALNNIPRALHHFEQARAAYAATRPPYVNGEMMVLNNSANAYTLLHQPAKANRAFRQALALADSTTDPHLTVVLLDGLGGGQLLAGHLDSAQSTLERGLALALKTRDLLGEAGLRGQLGENALSRGQPVLAQAEAERALALARQVGDPFHEEDALNVLAAALRAQGRIAAYDTLRSYLALHDTILAQDRSDAIIEAQTRFDVVAHQTRIRGLEQQRRIQRLQAEQQLVRTRGLGAGLAALGVMLLGGSFFYLRLRRTSAALAVSETTARAAEAQARRAVATKDQLMSIIGHDLRSPVATFQQVTPLLHHFADEPDPAALREIATALDASAHHLGALLDNLLYWARAEAGSLVNHPQTLPAADVLAEAAVPYQAGAQLKGVALTTAVFGPTADATEPLLLAADPDLLRTVLRNLVSNAVKFTPAGGQVRLRAWVEAPGQVTLEVRDTGVGIKPNRVADLFDAGAGDSTTGTAGEPGTGLGLPLSARFVRLLGSELRLVSLPPGQAGTAFRFTLPLVSEQVVLHDAH